MTWNTRHATMPPMSARTTTEPVGYCYTAQEVADILRVREDHVRRLCRDGRLAGFKVGKSWRVAPQRLAEFMNVEVS